MKDHEQRTVHVELKIGEYWIKTDPIAATPQMSAMTLADKLVIQLHGGGVKARVLVIKRLFDRF